MLATRPIDARELYDLARSLEVTLGLDVDLVDLMTASTVLEYELVTLSRQIQARDALC